MGRRFAELAFTPLVKEQQQQHGSRNLYERVEKSSDPGDRLGPDERTFIEERDGFYMASITENGWPYIQFRGGSKGFLQVLDERTIGFADLRGNKQYITVGNLQNNDRVAMFLMDYPAQSRLKILGRAKVHEGDADAQKLIETLRVRGEKAPAERALLIHIEAFDWNCPQHITPRYTEEELAKILEPCAAALASLKRKISACELRVADGSTCSPGLRPRDFVLLGFVVSHPFAKLNEKQVLRLSTAADRGDRRSG